MSLFSVTMTPLLRPDVDERRAVEADGVARGADAVDRVALRVVGAAAEADALERGVVGRDDAGQDAQQLERAAADDRQVVDLLGASARLRARPFPSGSLRCVRRDRDRLGLLPDLELHVDAAGVAAG